MIQGEPSSSVDSGILTFVNHGCNGTYNIGVVLGESEATVEVGTPVTTVYDARSDVYNPRWERGYHSVDCAGLVAIRDISAGDEILDNYLIFGGGYDQQDFDENLSDLKSMCRGEGGLVHIYEESEKGKS